MSAAEAERRELAADYPGWLIIRTRDTGRWWALRTTRQARRDDPSAQSPVTEVDADTPEQLRRKLGDVP